MVVVEKRAEGADGVAAAAHAGADRVRQPAVFFKHCWRASVPMTL